MKPLNIPALLVTACALLAVRVLWPHVAPALRRWGRRRVALRRLAQDNTQGLDDARWLARARRERSRV